MTHRNTAFVVVFVMFAAFTPAWGQELIFEDDFETGDISSWFGQTNCPPPPQTDCTPPAPANGTTPYNVGLVSAHIMNLDGSDAGQIWADLCGTNQCLNSVADVNGNMTLDGAGLELVEVEIFMHGTRSSEHYAPFGEWTKVSDAVVSSDGMVVTTNVGEGIEMLGLFGARLTAK